MKNVLFFFENSKFQNFEIFRGTSDAKIFWGFLWKSKVCIVISRVFKVRFTLKWFFGWFDQRPWPQFLYGIYAVNANFPFRSVIWTQTLTAKCRSWSQLHDGTKKLGQYSFKFTVIVLKFIACDVCVSFFVFHYYFKKEVFFKWTTHLQMKSIKLIFTFETTEGMRLSITYNILRHPSTFREECRVGAPVADQILNRIGLLIAVHRRGGDFMILPVSKKYFLPDCTLYVSIFFQFFTYCIRSGGLKPP